jgi:virginiamycin B lyase
MGGVTGSGGVTGVGGAVPTAARLTLTNPNGAFASVVIGRSGTHSYLVSNAGQQASSAITISLSTSTAFSLVTPGGLDCAAGMILAGGGSCTLQIQFTPQVIGAATATLSVSATVGGAPAGLTVSASGIAPPPGDLQEFLIPDGGAAMGIAPGPDGNLWFTDYSADKIGRITPAGAVKEFPTLTPGGGPESVVTGPDGNLWFGETLAVRIGRMTPAGGVTEFIEPTRNAYPYGITAGPDGNIWYATGGGTVGRITVAGAITEFPAPGTNIFGITVGSDKNIWLADGAGTIGRMTTAGVLTKFTVPAGRIPIAITAGPDGSLWFTHNDGVAIGKATTAGVLTEIPFASTGCAYNSIVTGPDGNVWISSYTPARIVRVIPGGGTTNYPTIGAPMGITVGPDKNIWFAEGQWIGRIAP